MITRTKCNIWCFSPQNTNIQVHSDHSRWYTPQQKCYLKQQTTDSKGDLINETNPHSRAFVIERWQKKERAREGGRGQVCSLD